ncbi:Clavaminate synthase-like protein [Bimuria novae-zelandiae CBS 107.79]|uniref:Clavaminate synthase-like protein n=1 Tax=Bimuria novae-zelandiae CBS 107.79 TaxID=1447943 RepID=A0A6A5V0D1_9PLEO|nr:Clavaminate synthase-like protein [Bimuria novae-zelandiae CBS 107.79]
MTASIAPRDVEQLKLDSDVAFPLVFEPVSLPSSNQRVLGRPHPKDTVTPLALQPLMVEGVQPTLESAISTIRDLQAKEGLFTKKLALHGTLLFRGLPIHSASDFSKFSYAFGYSPHEIIGIVVDRPLLAPNIAPANEAPKEVLIYNHNESPQVPHAPEYIFFYCHSAPTKGGETPISSSLELLQRAKEEMPEFIDILAEKGILSKVTYKVEQQYAGGSTLKQAFGKDIVDGDNKATRKRKVEEQIKRYGRGEHTTWKWTDDDETLTLTHHLPVIRTHPHTNLPTLFTGLAAYYKNFVDDSSPNSSRRNITKQLYGNGTPIPEEYLKRLADITDKIRVLHKWEQSDVLVYDNVISQHGRQPWEGKQEDRVILASLWDGDAVPGQYEGSQGDWVQVVQASA